jgi:hypothetical protein
MATAIWVVGPLSFACAPRRTLRTERVRDLPGDLGRDDSALGRWSNGNLPVCPIVTRRARPLPDEVAAKGKQPPGSRKAMPSQDSLSNLLIYAILSDNLSDHFPDTPGSGVAIASYGCM